MSRPTIDRRRFIVSAFAYSGGLAVSLSKANRAYAARSAARSVAAPASMDEAVEFTPWLTIARDDIVTVRLTTPEVGTGVLTQAAMCVTEELRCDWSKVRTEFASTSRQYRDKAYSYGQPDPFFSGRSTNPFLVKLQLQVGASARERLIAAAADLWAVPVAEIRASNSVLTHCPSGRTLRYGQVAERAATIRLAKEPQLKQEKEWTFLSKASPGKLQAPLIAHGNAIYGIDVRLPAMVYAALRQAPVHGGKLRHVNPDAVMRLPGVRAVVTIDPAESKGSSATPAGLSLNHARTVGAGDGWTLTSASPTASAAQSAVAVIADHYWQASKALDALPVEWDDGPGSRWQSSQQVYDTAVSALATVGEHVVKNDGDAGEIDKQGIIVEGTYLTPYCEHAAIEPLNGTALVTSERVDVWHPSQNPEQAFWVTVDETGMAPEQVHFHQTFVGGAFGRRVYGNDVRMVVAVARKYPDVPVHVIWSREEVMRQGRYRAMVAARLRAGLGARDGLPQALLARVAGHGHKPAGLTDCAYTNGIIPNVRIESQRLPLHIMTGPYRGPGYNSGAFYVETFIDECAHAAAMDPLEYRLKLFSKWPDPGWTSCLKTAASKAGWGKSLPRGVGQGIAIANFSMGGKPKATTTVCAVATVEVSRDGVIGVHALDIAFDSGRVLNRDAVAAQIEGAAIFGLNMSLNEELTIKDGRIVEGNFDAYPMLRMAGVPRKINVHFDALSGDERFGIIGESPAGPIGPAVGNAIFRATGKRIRSMPFRKQDLSWT